MTGKQTEKKAIPRELGDQVRESIEHYLANIRRGGLHRDFRPVLASIEKQYRASGWLSPRQIDVLRRCYIGTNIGNPVGGFGKGPCFGRNAPAGRGRGPV